MGAVLGRWALSRGLFFGRPPSCPFACCFPVVPLLIIPLCFFFGRCVKSRLCVLGWFWGGWSRIPPPPRLRTRAHTVAPLLTAALSRGAVWKSTVRTPCGTKRRRGTAVHRPHDPPAGPSPPLSRRPPPGRQSRRPASVSVPGEWCHRVNSNVSCSTYSIVSRNVREARVVVQPIGRLLARVSRLRCPYCLPST